MKGEKIICNDIKTGEGFQRKREAGAKKIPLSGGFINLFRMRLFVEAACKN